MARWERQQDPPSHCRNRNNSSFSSSLLDAIYRSLDDSDSKSTAPSLPLFSPAKDYTSNADFKFSPHPQLHPTTHHRTRDFSDDRRHRRFFSATSSSDSSTFSDLSSSSADSIALPRPFLTQPDRILSDPTPDRKGSAGSIRSRIRDLRKLPSPISPRARLSAFLNAIFNAAGGSAEKSKIAGGRVDPVNASALSRYKPGTSKEATSLNGLRKQEMVRLSPVNLVIADLRLAAQPCGGEGLVAARDRWKTVEEMNEFEKLEDDCESVSSSDLFELESLTVIGRLADELPVCETTNLGKSSAISGRNLLEARSHGHRVRLGPDPARTTPKEFGTSPARRPDSSNL